MEEQLRVLLEISFPATIKGRIYFKQLPHSRLIILEGKSILGQLGIDCRIINVGGTILKIFGIIALCVHPDRRGSGLASKLLVAAEKIAIESSHDFIVLMAHQHDLYEQNGFQRVQSANVKWLAIEERKSIILIEEDLGDCFMVKPLGEKLWPSGQIDMLGYLF